MSKQFSFSLDEAYAAGRFDILNVDITDGDDAIVITELQVHHFGFANFSSLGCVCARTK